MARRFPDFEDQSGPRDVGRWIASRREGPVDDDGTRVAADDVGRLEVPVTKTVSFRERLESLQGRAAKWLRECFVAAKAAPPDLHPIALVLVEAMASYSFMRETFGPVPDGIDDERFIAAWVEVALAVAARHGLPTS